MLWEEVKKIEEELDRVTTRSIIANERVKSLNSELSKIKNTNNINRARVESYKETARDLLCFKKFFIFIAENNFEQTNKYLQEFKKTLQ